MDAREDARIEPLLERTERLADDVLLSGDVEHGAVVVGADPVDIRHGNNLIALAHAHEDAPGELRVRYPVPGSARSERGRRRALQMRIQQRLQLLPELTAVPGRDHLARARERPCEALLRNGLEQVVDRVHVERPYRELV